MIIHDIEQNTPEWLLLHMGKPTASEFSRLVTSKGDPSKQMPDYAVQLAADLWSGEPQLDQWEGNQWTERGNELEEEARSYYEMKKDVDVIKVGFVTNDIAGCSPDGLVGDEGMTEFKCPSPGIHVKYLLANKLPTAYITQVQGSLWVTERDWCDFVAYHPVLDSLIIRVHRDDAYIKQLAESLGGFVEKMLSKREELKDLGYMRTPHE